MAERENSKWQVVELKDYFIVAVVDGETILAYADHGGAPKIQGEDGDAAVDARHFKTRVGAERFLGNWRICHISCYSKHYEKLTRYAPDPPKGWSGYFNRRCPPK